MPEIKDRYQLDPYKSIPDVWILDEDFQKMDIIDDYTSLIWSRRYYEVGDFELYVRVTDKNLRLLNVDLSNTVRFIMRNDTKEVMRIEKIEISTDAEEGDFITASGRDLRCLLYQRVTRTEEKYGTTIESPVNGDILNSNTTKIVDVIYDLVNLNVANPMKTGFIISGLFLKPTQVSDEIRKMPYFTMGTKPDLDIATSAMSVGYGENIGEKVEELCNDFRIGWKAEWNGSQIVFSCYEGADRTREVVFSEEFCNLVKFTNTENLEDFYNTMILFNTEVDEDGNESATDVVTFGEEAGFVRFEKGFNGSEDLDVPTTSTLRELLFAYKLPSSYNVHWISMTETSSGGSDPTYTYHYHEEDSSTPNPDDENRTGNDYMSADDPKIIITAYSASEGSWWGDDVWNISIDFLYYPFRIYSDEYLDDLKSATGNCGTVENINGVECYVVTRDNDPNKVLHIGTGIIRNKYWPWDADTGYFGNPWALTIPAEYSEDGEEHVFTIADGTSSSYNDETRWNCVPFSFDIELSSILINDRYTAKAYGMVEEALSTNDFEGEIAPDINYTYREDYDIGDKIRIKTDIGIQKDVRILEAVETFDSDGYNIEVKFGV